MQKTEVLCSVVVTVPSLDSRDSRSEPLIPLVFSFFIFLFFIDHQLFLNYSIFHVFSSDFLNLLIMMISNSFHTLYESFFKIYWSWENVVFVLHIGLHIQHYWSMTKFDCDEVWSVRKSMTKLAQRHSVWTSYRVSYPALPICDEIWLFVMDAVWSMTKLKNIMWISS
jgi:hypothetical protein